MFKGNTYIKWTSALALVAVALLAVGTAQAVDAVAGFQVNSLQSSSGKFVFQFDGLTLSTVANSTVDLTVDNTLFSGAEFAMSATKDGSTGVSVISGRNYSNTEFDGTFSFKTSGGQLILSATFNNALLTARTGAHSGALFDSTDSANTDVTFAAGPALGAAYPGFDAPSDFSFALSSLNPFNVSGAAGAQQLSAFAAKGSFVAQADIIPEPSGWLMVGMGMCGVVAVCRRRL